MVWEAKAGFGLWASGFGQNGRLWALGFGFGFGQNGRLWALGFRRRALGRRRLLRETMPVLLSAVRFLSRLRRVRNENGWRDWYGTNFKNTELKPKREAQSLKLKA